MNIKKLGHCCLLVNTGSVTILTDPGMYSTAQNEITGIDIVLITHEHQDHFHIDSVKKILLNNPNVKIVSNGSVCDLLEKENIGYIRVREGERNNSLGVVIEGYGHKHAEIYKEFGQVENTGYFIDGKLFYPGDSFTNPNRSVDILALPVAGPWMKFSEAVNYAIEIKPRVSFPVHDAIYASPGFVHTMLKNILGGEGIEFVPMMSGDEKDYK
jgi:L-ascorbate metabolism protein UlaG (beta-lactamase superfamily)